MLSAKTQSELSICFVGGGYVGGCTGAVIAQMCPSVNVHVVDRDEAKTASWNSNTLPIHEAALEETVLSQRNKNLFFSTDLAQAVSQCSIVFLCVHTPQKDAATGIGHCHDLSHLFSAVSEIVAAASTDIILVEKSTVPCKTAEAIRTIAQAQASPSIAVEVLSNPEFLAQGSAISDIRSPDRVLVGCLPTDSGRRAQEQLCSLYRRWIPEERILCTDMWTSELAKIASNAVLAQRVSSINALGELCEKVGANVLDLSRIVGADRRIGKKYLHCGIGFGGSCLRKDLSCLVYLCERHGLLEAAAYWQSVLDMNARQKMRFVDKIIEKMFFCVSGKKIAVLGMAFKKDTADLRDTPSLEIVSALLSEHASVRVYDPVVAADAIVDLLRPGVSSKASLSVSNTAFDACAGADALVICTDWPEFESLDFISLYSAMNKPAFLFDGRNILDLHKLAAIGFYVYAPGLPM